MASSVIKRPVNNHFRARDAITLPYTCPSDGWIWGRGEENSVLAVNGTSYLNMTASNGGRVFKGDTLTALNLTIDTLYFYPNN